MGSLREYSFKCLHCGSSFGDKKKVRKVNLADLLDSSLNDFDNFFEELKSIHAKIPGNKKRRAFPNVRSTLNN